MSFLDAGHLVLAQMMWEHDDPWTRTFFGLGQGQRFVVIIVAIGCATALLLGTFGIISSAINSVHRRRAEIELKREMIDRGMSADEIAKVIESAAPPEDATQRWIASWARKKT
ncbi:MAG TPA: hypothetical protein VGK58_14185 [Lacipirellulaceae bacterium]